MAKHLIKIYTTNSCKYCKIAKDYLTLKGENYEEFDVANDVEKRDEMLSMTGMSSVPVIVIDGKIMVGYDKEQIDNLL